MVLTAKGLMDLENHQPNPPSPAPALARLASAGNQTP
jgi:hypothetical protein